MMVKTTLNMSPERWQQVQTLFHRAAAQPVSERGEFLSRTCGDDLTLRREIEDLLAKNDSSTGMFDNPDCETKGTSDVTSTSVRSDQLGPYRIERRIGIGGMGEVFQAVDSRLARQVAIKICSQRFGDRFEREARAISKLNHPHICTLYDVGPNYLVMELLEGSTLAAAIKTGPLPVEQVARLGQQIAEALAEAHSCGIVHRDLKPGNIMLTRHGVKVLDFGIAKMTTETSSTVTETQAVVGTPGYMAPEQVLGHPADARTDLFSLGLVLYEMAAGKLPFPGVSLGRILTGESAPPIPIPSRVRSEVPASLDALITRLLEKEPNRRYQSAAEVAVELEALAAPRRPSPWRPAYSVPAAAALLLLIGGGTWGYRRMENRRWAREDAIPEITRLVGEGKPLEALPVLRRAEQYLPGDPKLAQIERDGTRLISVTSSPAGATVEIKDYNSPGDPWFLLGATPLKQVTIPNGYFRWRVAKAGVGESVTAPLILPATKSVLFDLQPAGVAEGMVHVNGGPWGEIIDFVGWMIFNLPAFDADKYEVTNRQYQEFVDHGGYQKRDYWNEKFIRDGKELTWEQAMEQFRDPTGRPGPSTWEAGHFPEGKGDYPVSGVSWYEAAAYTAFAGKTLPAMAQFYKLAPTALARVNEGNFGGIGPMQVGASGEVGPYGTYDMLGNVREWSLNEFPDGRRFILGGGWQSQPYQGFDPEALPPFDRSPLNGFRGVRNREPLAAAVTAPVTTYARDFSTAKPASDDKFELIKSLYAYDRGPLNAKSEGIVEDTAAWTKEKVTIDAGYGNQRLTMYLFLPKNVHAPYQTVLFFPSARVSNAGLHSEQLGDMQFVSYAIKSGRALAYPIYQGTYERVVPVQAHPGEIGARERVIQQSKEVRRTMDYLETRPDIDKTRIAYLGVSAGTAYGVIYAALEPRLKTIVFLDGGFFLNPPPAGMDQVDFAPRIKKPVLMLNGRYDFTFSPDRSQVPLFRMLGTPDADKRRLAFDTPHDISLAPELPKEVLDWLDKYLGRVNG
jgi:eukaryotic-like serine/threonine-protein kinase